MIMLGLTLSLGSALYGQKHLFSVHRGGKEIGEISASLTATNQDQTYQILSNVSFKILWKNYHRRTSNLVVYQGELLKTSYSGVYMNDDLQDSTSLNQEPDSYRVFKYPDDHYLFDDADMSFSTAKLYFQEPVGIQKVYSERFLQYCQLEAQGDHKYKLYLPDNRTNYYTYVNNELVEVAIDRTWFNVKFLRK